MVPRTLLIVDEDPALEGMVQNALPVCRVVSAGGVGEALDAVRAHKPAVVALSVALPSGETDAAPRDGLDALSLILGEAPSIKVIALTPRDERTLAVRAVARGAHEVCCKPIDAHEFATVVQRAFQRADLELEGRRLNTGDAPPTLRVLRDETERRALIDALARSGGNLSATARLLGISRPTLYSLLRQHGIRAE
ncbi:helix-turn-helix domain-containing protein [Azospirillum rugosum]|uniref:DNA-binding NtrC family response regulator n=1 Tax=Azospirillum rugosum TaxID=416170 RepID=A0ABS4SSP1_9PROT|nr:helix-turn-helix domain-containing protein [Azospirillum rugosum]MBP2295578.1 DNA-binding NtrC family response regulator [Azospirillum rugosum]MDQ0529532.1 DNA-binding NtrC family response regulator [Azospirillum rugosum]